MDRIKLATIWLGGCSGCHMSLLDLDEWLFELAKHVDMVYGPVVDTKEYPANVDVVMVEGAVCNEEHVHLIHTIRKNTKILIAFGDCAVTGNVTALRNPLGSPESCLRRAYIELATANPQIPSFAPVLPPLIDRVYAVHEVVPVDFYLPGCPPPAARIRTLIEQLLQNGTACLAGNDIKFG